MEKLFLEVVAHLLNIEHGELEKSLKKDGKLIEDQKEIESKIKELHESNLDTYSSARRKAFDDGYKKAQKKVMEDRESELRTKYEVEGDDLESIVESIEQKARKNAELNPSDVKNSETYINDVEKFKKRVEALENELDQEKDGRRRDQVEGKIDSNLESWLKESGKALSSDEEVRKQQVKLIKLQLREMGIDPRLEDDKIIPYKDDSVMVDEKTMKELSMSGVMGKAALFLPDAKSGGGQSPGNRNTGGERSGSGFDFSHVTNEEQFNNEVTRINQKEDSKAEFDALISYGESIGL